MEEDYLSKLLNDRLRHTFRVAFIIGALAGSAAASGFTYVIVSGLLCR